MENEPNKASTIAEAAQMLGVSRRTVYRHLKQGTLLRVKKGDTWIVNTSQFVSKNTPIDLNAEVITSSDVSNNDMNSDIGDMISDIQPTKELSVRDEAIRRLEAENQQLRQSLASLQEQMYELAKQTVSQAIQAQTQQLKNAAPRRSGFAAFFSRKR